MSRLSVLAPVDADVLLFFGTLRFVSPPRYLAIKRLVRGFDMPLSACCLQYTAVLLPSTLKDGLFVQESCEQRMLRTFTIPSWACCSQYIGVLVLSTLKLGRVVHESFKQCLLRTSTIPASACCLQKSPVLLPSTLKDGRVVHESCKQCFLDCLLYTSPSPRD